MNSFTVIIKKKSFSRNMFAFSRSVLVLVAALAASGQSSEVVTVDWYGK